jgi:hypothetical protein
VTPDLGNLGITRDKEVAPFTGIKWRSVYRRESPQSVPFHHKAPRMIIARLSPPRKNPKERFMDYEHIPVKRTVH